MKRLFLAVLIVLAAGAFVRLAAEDAPDLYAQGAELLGQGKFAEAVAILKKEVDAHPTNTKAYMYLATAYEKLSQWKDAAAAWDKFVRLTDSVEEKAFGEKSAKNCRDRAGGKVADDATKPAPATTPDTAPAEGDYAKYETQQPVFYAAVKTRHFIVMAKNKDLLDATAIEAERHLKRIMDIFLFGREWSHTITIRIYKDHKDYTKEAGMPEWSGGGYSARDDGAGGELLAIDLYALDQNGKYDPKLLSKVLPHEMTHAVIHESFGQRAFSTLPRAVNEGLAMYSEEGTEVLYERELCDAVKRGVKVYKLGELYTMANYPPNVALFYAEAASATRYLIEHLKASEFETFINELKKGQSVNSALQTAKMNTGDLLDAVEANWMQMLKQKADYYASHPLSDVKTAKNPMKDAPKPVKVDPKTPKPDPSKPDPTKTEPAKTDPTKPEPYDPLKNEKKKPGDEDDEKDVVIEVK